MMHDIQAITFDAGGTLIEPWPSVGHVYAEVAREHGVRDATPEDLNLRFTKAWLALGGRAESRSDWAAIVRATFEGLTPPPDHEALFETLYRRFADPGAWHVFADVPPALEAIRSRGIRLGIVSNWDDRLRPLLDRLGLARCFEVIVVSCEVGCRKPDPEIFEHTSQEFGLPPARILHVGDHPDHDLIGARRAGWSAVGIRRGLAQPGAHWISRLDALLDRLN